MTVALLAVAAFAAGAGAAVVPDLRRQARDEQRLADARQTRLEQAERGRLRSDRRAHRARLPEPPAGVALPRRRQWLVSATERRIALDARGRIAAGTMEGPVIGADCQPFPRTASRISAERDPAARRLRYDCVALKSRFELPASGGRRREGLYGYPYWAVIDHARHTVAWCRVTPRAGEGGRSLASVPVPLPCREPS